MIRWSENVLRELVASARRFDDLLAKLDLDDTPLNRARVRRWIRQAKIDTAHLQRKMRGRHSTKWSDQDLVVAVRSSTTYAMLLRSLDLVPRGGNYAVIKAHIARLGLDTSHFAAGTWTVERSEPQGKNRPLSEFLVAGRSVDSNQLKRKLIKAGLRPACCELCGWAQHASDGRVPIELDHINGDRFDNRLENLRILCPNCHSLQPTHRGLNRTYRAQRSDSSNKTRVVPRERFSRPWRNYW
jgi:5-methylcytosine-specific restriction endonuclease McrA